MALDKATLIQDIKNIQDDLKDKTDYEAARDEFAQKLADAIEKHLKSGTVNITGTSNQGTFTGSGTIE